MAEQESRIVLEQKYKLSIEEAATTLKTVSEVDYVAKIVAHDIEVFRARVNTVYAGSPALSLDGNFGIEWKTYERRLNANLHQYPNLWKLCQEAKVATEKDEEEALGYGVQHPEPQSTLVHQAQAALEAKLLDLRRTMEAGFDMLEGLRPFVFE
ncbi:hypothetical protein ABW21_db0209069 [Orbilia brochopaga]|nr:hypothetical protein ABW21_db0209069 [Drechslerella brochopaga]